MRYGRPGTFTRRALRGLTMLALGYAALALAAALAHAALR